MCTSSGIISLGVLLVLIAADANNSNSEKKTELAASLLIMIFIDLDCCGVGGGNTPTMRSSGCDLDSTFQRLRHSQNYCRKQVSSQLFGGQLRVYARSFMCVLKPSIWSGYSPRYSW